MIGGEASDVDRARPLFERWQDDRARRGTARVRPRARETDRWRSQPSGGRGPLFAPRRHRPRRCQSSRAARGCRGDGELRAEDAGGDFRPASWSICSRRIAALWGRRRAHSRTGASLGDECKRAAGRGEGATEHALIKVIERLSGVEGGEVVAFTPAAAARAPERRGPGARDVAVRSCRTCASFLLSADGGAVAWWVGATRQRPTALAVAQRAFGDLRGLSSGPDALDREPQRRVVDPPQMSTSSHERSYAQHAARALTAGRGSAHAAASGATADRPTLGDAESIVAALAQRRSETDGALAGTEAAELSKPSQWRRDTPFDVEYASASIVRRASGRAHAAGGEDPCGARQVRRAQAYVRQISIIRRVTSRSAEACASARRRLTRSPMPVVRRNCGL